MAKEGMTFTQHYAGCPVCAPSRSSLMTGLHTGHTPIRGNKEWKPEGQWPMAAASVTIAEMLKQADYVTGGFGKWGLGYPGSEGDANMQGFDTFYGYNCQRLAHNYYPGHLWDNQQQVILEEIKETDLKRTHQTRSISRLYDLLKSIKIIHSFYFIHRPSRMQNYYYRKRI